MPRKKRDRYFLDILEIAKTISNYEVKTACLLVRKDNRLLSLAANETSSGWMIKSTIKALIQCEKISEIERAYCSEERISNYEIELFKLTSCKKIICKGKVIDLYA